MKQKTSKLAQFKQWILSIVIIRFSTSNTSENDWGIKGKKYDNYDWVDRSKTPHNVYKCYYEIWLWYPIFGQWKWSYIYFLRK